MQYIRGLNTKRKTEFRSNVIQDDEWFWLAIPYVLNSVQLLRNMKNDIIM